MSNRKVFKDNLNKGYYNRYGGNMGLINFLMSNTDSRKIFGRKELEIIKKQMFGINLSQSERNRLSRDIRPKLKFMREIDKFSEEFDLKKGFENKKLIEDAKNKILGDFVSDRIERIWLFGSFVENKMTSRSDLDIAVEFDRINKKQATQFRVRILGNVSDKMDIQVFNFLDDKIKKEILKKGKVLYENEK